MWLPKIKYLSGLFALKGIFKLPDGSDYEGPYHENEFGEFATGDTPSVDSVTIVKDTHELSGEEEAQREFFSSMDVLPTPKDYKRGYFDRYFLKNTITNKIIEVDLPFFEEKQKQLYIKRLIIKWIIDKPLKDIFNQGYVYKGTISRNKESVMRANLVMKGIIEYITDYAKFADIESDVEGYKFEELPPKEQTRIIKQTSSNLRNKPKPIKEEGGNLRDGGGLRYINKPVPEDSDGDGIFDFETEDNPLGGPTGDNEPTGSRRSGGGGGIDRLGDTGETNNISNVYRD